MDPLNDTAPPSTLSPALPATARSLPISLIRARESVMQPVRQMLADTGLTEQQWRVLRILEEGPMDASQLAERAALLAPSLTRIIQAMAKQEYLSRTADPEDRRRQVISILPKGQAMIAENKAHAAKIATGFIERLGQKDYDHLLDLLEKLIDPDAPHSADQ